MPKNNKTTTYYSASQGPPWEHILAHPGNLFPPRETVLAHLSNLIFYCVPLLSLQQPYWLSSPVSLKMPGNFHLKVVALTLIIHVSEIFFAWLAFSPHLHQRLPLRGGLSESICMTFLLWLLFMPLLFHLLHITYLQYYLCWVFLGFFLFCFAF